MSTMTSGERRTAIVMLVAAAATYGGIFSASKAAATLGWPPLAFAFAQSFGAGIALLAYCLALAGGLPLSRRHLLSYFVIGGLVIGLPQTLLTWVAPNLTAGMMTLVLALAPPLTFVFAALLRIDRFTLRGLLGIGISFLGVVVLVGPGSDLARSGDVLWFFLALLAPVCFAGSNVATALLRPPATTSTAMAAGMLLGSALMLLPAILLTGTPPLPTTADLAVWTPGLLAMAINVVFILLYFEIIRRAGPTFFSQFNYLAVVAGVLWGMALFGETPGWHFWVAFALMLIGIRVTLTATKPASDGPPPQPQ
jgi:drug/metabolite transporter (DMT)-like permease